MSSTKYNFLLKDNIFSRERSISGQNLSNKSQIFGTSKISLSNSVEGLIPNKFLQDSQVNKQLIKVESQENEKQDSDSDSSKEEYSKEEGQRLQLLQTRERGDSLKHVLNQNIYNPNLLSSKLINDIPINVVNLSSSIFIISCAHSQQLKTYSILENNKVIIKGSTPLNSLKHIQKSLTSGLFYQFGNSKCQQGEKVNIIQLQQLSESGHPVEIIEMRDLHQEELEIIIPLAEYTQISKKYEQKPYAEESTKGAINFLQFAGIFQENQGYRTIKVWQMQLKNGDVKKSQISCLCTFQIETCGEQIGQVRLYNSNQFLIYTSNTITKVSFTKTQQDRQNNQHIFKYQLKKRAFKFESGIVNSFQKVEQDKINCCCQVGTDKLLICTKKGILYLLELDTLEVISITDYNTRCKLSSKAEILKCECPFNVDESDIQDKNIVRLIASFSQFENKIYLYNVESQNNLLESPFIFNPILFCFYGKSTTSQNNFNNKMNDMTLILIEENIPFHSSTQISEKGRSSTFYSPREQTYKKQYQQQTQKVQTTLINFYKPLKEISKQLLKSGTDFQKLSKMNSQASPKQS